MPWPTLTEVKNTIGVTVSTDDVLLQSIIDSTALAIENYLNRKLEFKANEVEHFFDLRNHTLSLRRYPITQVHSPNFTVVDKEAGILHYSNRGTGHEVKVDYDGGYAQIPADILLAFYEILKGKYATKGSSGGITSPVKKQSIPGVMTVEYAVDTSGGGGSTQVNALQPDYYDYLLAPYHRITV